MTGTASDPSHGRAPDGPPGLPRWVRLLVIGGVVAVVLVVVMLLVGGGHGPGMHGL